jgi:hypothetical protein
MENKKILGMAEHGKSSFIAILTPVHALLDQDQHLDPNQVSSTS